MSLFGETGGTPGPEGQRPEAPVPGRPPTRRYRRPAVVLLAALAVALVLNVAEVKVLQRDPAPTRPPRLASLENDMGPSPQDIALGRVVAADLEQTQTDPGAWSHVTQIRVLSLSIVVIQVDTRSDAVAERVCKQARHYMFSPSPYGPKLRHLMILSIVDPPRQLIDLDDKNDACIAR
jgi:hypothetical protein